MTTENMDKKLKYLIQPDSFLMMATILRTMPAMYSPMATYHINESGLNKKEAASDRMAISENQNDSLLKDKETSSSSKGYMPNYSNRKGEGTIYI